MKVLGIITARGGSKGIPRKNLFPLNGKPLIEYTIQAGKECNSIDRLILSTDSSEIADYCAGRGIEVPFLRPDHLSTDAASSRDVVIHMIEKLKEKEDYIPDAILVLQPTSPLRTSQHLEEAISLFKRHSEVDSLVSVVEVPHNFSPTSVFKVSNEDLVVPSEDDQVYRRQDKEVLFARNGAAIYLSKTYVFDKDYPAKNVLGKKVLAYKMSRDKSIDIDSYEDLYIASLILNGPSSEEWLDMNLTK